MQTLKEYLADLGMLGKDVPESTLAPIKQAYYQLYHKQYYQKYKHKKVRVEMRFTKSEYAILKASAKQHKKRTATHIKNCALAYLNQTYVTVDESTLHDLKMEVRAIGNNINQIAYQSNSTQGKVVDVDGLFHRLAELEQVIEAKLTAPPSLQEMLRKAVMNGRITKHEIEKIFS